MTGSFIGTCAGAFYGLQHVQFYGQGPENRGPPTQDPFNRGHGLVKIEFDNEGRSMLHLPSPQWDGNITIMFWQGPIVKAADLPSNVTKLAYFRTEIDNNPAVANETRGEMLNTPAITSIKGYGIGNGRVVLNSPHPEFDPQLPAIYVGELLWVTKRSASLVSQQKINSTIRSGTIKQS